MARYMQNVALVNAGLKCEYIFIYNVEMRF